MAAISPQTFITDTLNAVDSVIGQFVQNTYQGLVQSNQTTITLLFTFYVMFLGYRFVMHTLNADANSIARHLIVMLIVYGLLMNWSLYNTFVYNIFTNEPSSIASVLVSASGQYSTSQSVNMALNDIYTQGINAAVALFAKASWANWQFIFYGAAVIFFTFIGCLFGLFLLIYAKLAMAVGLALGPIFIVFVLWESTRGWFVAWLQKLINFALVPIVTAGILSLMLSVLNLTMPGLTSSVDSGNPSFFQICIFGGLSIITAFLLKQTLSIASSLSGGLTLEGLSRAVDMVKSTLQNTGATAIGSAAGRGIKAGADKIGSTIAARRAESRKKAASAAQSKKYDNWV